MKQIEITVRVLENVNSAIKKLEEIGFKKIRESDIDDIYMSAKLNELNKDNIQYILKKSVLLRSIKTEKEEFRKITYKNKEFDKERKCIVRTKNKLRL